MIFNNIEERTEEPERVEKSTSEDDDSIDALVSEEQAPPQEHEDQAYSVEELPNTDPNAGKYGPALESGASIQYGSAGQDSTDSPGYRSPANQANPGYHP